MCDNDPHLKSVIPVTCYSTVCVAQSTYVILFSTDKVKYVLPRKGNSPNAVGHNHIFFLFAIHLYRCHPVWDVRMRVKHAVFPSNIHRGVQAIVKFWVIMFIVYESNDDKCVNKQECFLVEGSPSAFHRDDAILFWIWPWAYHDLVTLNWRWPWHVKVTLLACIECMTRNVMKCNILHTCSCPWQSPCYFNLQDVSMCIKSNSQPKQFRWCRPRPVEGEIVCLRYR